ncbi:MAG: leucine-rich repeat protein [Clostridia bacterium]|nr:leucine-rich repeat protein [Clostridia bacterium]
MKKKLLLVLITAILALSAFALVGCGDSSVPATEGLEYKKIVGKNEYMLSNFGTATTPNVVIASTYNNMPVTTIGENAFLGASEIVSVKIPSSVKVIAGGAFYECSNLTYITIPSSVMSIGDGAFSYCKSLTSITIPGSVTSIGEGAFRYCTNLTSITIPDSVTSIGEGAFRYCTSLTSITIGNRVTSIGVGVFLECSSLAKVFYTGTIDQWVEIEFGGIILSDTRNLYINDTLVTNANITTATKINSYAFRGCSNLTSVTIPSSVTSIGSSAFYNCSRLESIVLPFVGAMKDGTSDMHFGYIFGARAYSSNNQYVPTSLKTVVIKGGTSIVG